MISKNIIFCLIIFTYVHSYVLRSKINGNLCKIDIDKSVFNIIYDDNFCNNDISQSDLFSFNDCNSKKEEINKGIELWSKNTNKIKVNYNSDIYKENFINITIKNKEISSGTVAEAHRLCQTKLQYGSIHLNKNKCFYPDNFFCILNNILLIFVILLFILLNISFLTCIIIQYKFEKLTGYVILLSTIFFICLSSFYVIYKCNVCSPLKITTAHEFGHILGFSHPDQHDYFNLVGKYENCKVINKIINKNYDKNSIMLSIDIKKNTGISLNDKIGLYDLYPSCKFSNAIYTNFKSFNKNNYIFFSILFGYISILPIIILLKCCINYIKNNCLEISEKTQVEIYEPEI